MSVRAVGHGCSYDYAGIHVNARLVQGHEVAVPDLDPEHHSQRPLLCKAHIPTVSSLAFDNAISASLAFIV